jgi:hypothetical protein
MLNYGFKHCFKKFPLSIGQKDILMSYAVAVEKMMSFFTTFLPTDIGMSSMSLNMTCTWYLMYLYLKEETRHIA